MTTGSRQGSPAADAVVVSETDAVGVVDGETVGSPLDAFEAPAQPASITASVQIPSRFTTRKPSARPVSYGVPGPLFSLDQKHQFRADLAACSGSEPRVKPGKAGRPSSVTSRKAYFPTQTTELATLTNWPSHRPQPMRLPCRVKSPEMAVHLGCGLSRYQIARQKVPPSRHGLAA